MTNGSALVLEVFNFQFSFARMNSVNKQAPAWLSMSLRVKIDKTHSEHNESGPPPNCRPTSISVVKGHKEKYAVQQNGPYSITSSAVSRNSCEIVSPSDFAVLRLTVSSFLVGACTGRSAGLAPRRMRSR